MKGMTKSLNDMKTDQLRELAENSFFGTIMESNSQKDLARWILDLVTGNAKPFLRNRKEYLELLSEGGCHECTKFKNKPDKLFSGVEHDFPTVLCQRCINMKE